MGAADVEVSEVYIANLALQKVGAALITSLTEGSVNADAVLACFAAERNKLLRSHLWGFAIVRAQLSTLASAPAFGRSNAFQLPADFQRLAPVDPEANSPWRDWKIESGCIVTNDSAPLNIRYVAKITDPTKFDSCFVLALAAMIALQVCEPLTQSSTKKADIMADLKDALKEAKRTDAMEEGPGQEPEDTLILSRRRGSSLPPSSAGYGWSS